jgi:hypothetical protein
MKFVDDAKQAWRWFSVQAMTLALAIQGAWEVIPADMRASIPQSYVTYTTLALLALGIGGRLLKQGDK